MRMTLLVDTSFWSLVLRWDAPSVVPEVLGLRRLLEAGEGLVTAGIVLQELLQGFSALPLWGPDREDHIEAASLRQPAAGQACRSEPSMPCLHSCASVTS